MTTRLNELAAIDPDSGCLNVVIDTPKGSRNKYKFDEQHAQWRLSKVLPQGMCFPYDFGFVPSTLCEDGDPLDVLLLMDEPTFPGCIVPARLIGVIEGTQTEEETTIRNDRLIAVVETRFNPAEFHSLDELDKQRVNEIERFFVNYNEVEGRTFEPTARHGAHRANELLNQAMRERASQE